MAEDCTPAQSSVGETSSQTRPERVRKVSKKGRKGRKGGFSIDIIVNRVDKSRSIGPQAQESPEQAAAPCGLKGAAGLSRLEIPEGAITALQLVVLAQGQIRVRREVINQVATVYYEHVQVVRVSRRRVVYIGLSRERGLRGRGMEKASD